MLLFFFFSRGKASDSTTGIIVNFLKFLKSSIAKLMIISQMPACYLSGKNGESIFLVSSHGIEFDSTKGNHKV